MHIDKQSMVPPDELGIQFGAGDYLAVSDKIVRLFQDRFDLRPTSRVLDVGCGAGRVAIGLTDVLTPPGEYHGFDTYPFGIDWCNKRIAPQCPNFHFQTIDVHNTTYNPYAKDKASGFAFPYDDDSFDIVLLKSVFTHMFPDDMLHYTSEISRVMRPGGHALITFFLLDDESRRWQSQTAQGPKFKKFGLFYTEDPKDPLDCVGYDRPFVETMFQQHHLSVSEIISGNWCGRPGANMQDYVLLTKRNASTPL